MVACILHKWLVLHYFNIRMYMQDYDTLVKVHHLQRLNLLIRVVLKCICDEKIIKYISHYKHT